MSPEEYAAFHQCLFAIQIAKVTGDATWLQDWETKYEFQSDGSKHYIYLRDLVAKTLANLPKVELVRRSVLSKLAEESRGELGDDPRNRHDDRNKPGDRNKHDDRDRHDDRNKPAIGTNTTTGIDTTTGTSPATDGRAMAVEFISNVYLVNNDKVIQCNIRDITDRKMIANALQKAHDEMEHRVEERTIELRTALFEIKTMKDRLEAENIYFRQEIKSKRRFNDIVGENDGLRYVLYRAEQVASTDTTILILGGNRYGKRIDRRRHPRHESSQGSTDDYRQLRSPARQFNRERIVRSGERAFTGADTRQIGRFEIADGSTLCLDEIGELPLDMQAKLLRVIQHNEFERLGSSRTIKVNTRIVATTNRNLEEEVRKGRFRQDLYYRLNVFPITVPPLRQRKEDIPLLVQSFVNRYARKLGKTNHLDQCGDDEGTTELSVAREYPGAGKCR